MGGVGGSGGVGDDPFRDFFSVLCAAPWGAVLLWLGRTLGGVDFAWGI